MRNTNMNHVALALINIMLTSKLPMISILLLLDNNSLLNNRALAAIGAQQVTITQLTNLG